MRKPTSSCSPMFRCFSSEGFVATLALAIHLFESFSSSILAKWLGSLWPCCHNNPATSDERIRLNIDERRFSRDNRANNAVKSSRSCGVYGNDCE